MKNKNMKNCTCIHKQVQIGDNDGSNKCPLHKNDPPGTKLIRTAYVLLGG